MSTELTWNERGELKQHEKVIAKGLSTFIEVGRALAAIREQKLYRNAHKTFEAYCKDRWGIDRHRAHRLIEGSAAVENVVNLQQNPPAIESHAVELAKLKDPEQQAEAWAEAQKSAGDSGVTAKVVQDAVKKRIPSTSRPAPQASGNGSTTASGGASGQAEQQPGPTGDGSAGSEPETTAAAPENGDSEPGPSEEPDTETLEAVQADLKNLEKQCRDLVREIRQTMQFKGNEAQRPYCGRYSKLAVIQPIEAVARTIKNEMPVDGTPDEPILNREQQQEK